MSEKRQLLLLILFSIFLAVTLPFYISIGWEAAPIIFTVWFFTKGIGSEIGAHRLWSHRSFKTTRLNEKILIILDTLAGEGSIIAFAGIHKLHHRYSDTEHDPHNPHTHLWQTFFLQSDTKKFDARLVKDLLSDPWLVFQHKNYFKIQIVIILSFALMSPVILWYYAINVLLTVWTDFVVNVPCHLWGKTTYELNNTSKNNIWAMPVLLGAHLHNNHHAKPGEYDFAWEKNEFDLWGKIIKQIKISEIA
jgi:stearoyl-CoA desaturase (delta-9 desaturase)